MHDKPFEIAPAEAEACTNQIKSAMAIIDLMTFIDCVDSLCDDTIAIISGVLYQMLLDALTALNGKEACDESE